MAFSTTTGLRLSGFKVPLRDLEGFYNKAGTTVVGRGRCLLLLMFWLRVWGLHTHRLHSSSFSGLPYRILNMNPKKELRWSLWVVSVGGLSCDDRGSNLGAKK